jgi:hypothetical protein
MNTVKMPSSLCRNARLAVLCLALLGVYALTTFSRADPSDLEKLRRIPPADLHHSGSDNIPYVVLTDKGAFINHSKDPVAFNQVLKALANLPKSAWPCGRLIEFHPSPSFGLQSILNAPKGPPESKVNEVEADLKAAGIKQITIIST